MPPVWPRARPLIMGTATPGGCGKRRDEERSAVADAAGRVLVDRGAPESSVVKDLAGVAHGRGQGVYLVEAESAQKGGHEPRGKLL